MRFFSLVCVGSFLLSSIPVVALGQSEVRSKITFESVSEDSFSTRHLEDKGRPSYIVRSNLGNNSRATLITDVRWKNLSESILKTMQLTHEEYDQKLGPIPPTFTTVRIVPKDRFHAVLKLPLWTNAIFFRGEIIIPVSSSERIDKEELARSVKHEYVHALIHELGGSKVPGWFDEGLAQWTEGTAHASLPMLLNKWLERRSFIPLSKLSTGFTKLESRKVPVAYAQSLFAIEELIARFGFQGISKYLLLLRKGASPNNGFRLAFGEDMQEFERNAERAVRAKLRLRFPTQ